MFVKNIFNIMQVHATFFVLLLCAVALNAYLFYSYPNVGGDTLSFLLPIHHWFAGDGYSLGGKPELLFSPGYGILSGLVYLFVRDIEYSGMLVSGLSYIGIIIVAYVGVERIFDKRAGTIVAIFLVFSPAHVALSYITIADLPVAFFIVLSAFMTLCAILYSCSFVRYTLLGMVLGFGTLIRPDCLVVAGAAILIIAFDVALRISRSEISCRRGVTSLMLVVIGFLICNLPYMIFLHHYTGKWTFSNKLALVVVGGSGISDVPIDASLIGTLQNQIYQNFPALIARLRQNGVLCIYSLVVCTFYIIIPMSLVWLSHPFLAFRRFRDSIINSRSSFLGLVVVTLFSTPLIPYLFYAKDDRRWIPYWTLVIIACGVFVYYLLRGIIDENDNKSWRVAQILMAILVVTSPYIPVPSFLHPHSLYESLTIGHGHFGLRDAGVWLRDNVPIEDRTKILSRKPSVVVFYASDKNISSSYGDGIDKEKSIEQNIKTLDNLNFKYLILDAHYIKEMPSFTPLWENPEVGIKYGLRLVASSPSTSFQIFIREKG